MSPEMKFLAILAACPSHAAQAAAIAADPGFEPLWHGLRCMALGCESKAVRHWWVPPAGVTTAAAMLGTKGGAAKSAAQAAARRANGAKGGRPPKHKHLCHTCGAAFSAGTHSMCGVDVDHVTAACAACAITTRKGL